MGTATHASCYNCSHLKCNSCPVYSQENFAHAYGTIVNDHSHVSDKLPVTHDALFPGLLPSLGHIGHAFTCSYNNHGEPVDGKEYRWSCHHCFSDNSYSHDAACWNCQHWLCKSCDVYEVIRKQR
jgi:hypothetical protein